MTTVYVGGHWCVPVLSAARHSAGGAEERNAPQPEGIDGPRRAQRQLKLKRIISTIALMKELHQKKTKKKPAFAAAKAWSSPYPLRRGTKNLQRLLIPKHGACPGMFRGEAPKFSFTKPY